MGGFDIGSVYFDNRRDVSSLKRQAEVGKNPEVRATGQRGRAQRTVGHRKAVDRKSRLYTVCQDFESIFIKQMLNVMRKTVHKSGLMDGGMAEEIFEDMLYEKYALKMARSGQFGISDMLYKELS